MNPMELLFADADIDRDDELELESWELDDDENDENDENDDDVELSLDEWLESLS